MPGVVGSFHFRTEKYLSFDDFNLGLGGRSLFAAIETTVTTGHMGQGFFMALRTIKQVDGFQAYGSSSGSFVGFRMSFLWFVWHLFFNQAQHVPRSLPIFAEYMGICQVKG